MSNTKEAINDIQDAMNLLYDTTHPMPRSAIMGKLSKAKMLLESEPAVTEPGEFTKKCRNFGVNPQKFGLISWRQVLFIACDIIDRLTARINAMYAGDLSPESRLNGYAVIVDSQKKRITELKNLLDEWEAYLAEHKQVIDRLTAGNKAYAEECGKLADECLKLQAENDKLKEALESIRVIPRNFKSGMTYAKRLECMVDIAEQALKGTE